MAGMFARLRGVNTAPLTMTGSQIGFSTIGGPLGAAGMMGQIPQPSAWQSMLGPVSQGLNIFSGVLGAIGDFKAAGSLRSQARQYKLMGQQALEQGFQTGIDISKEGEEVTGTMTAMFGKSGSLLEGSPLLVLADTQTKIDRDIARVIEQGRIQKAAYDWQARQAKKAAKSAKTAGLAKIAGTAATLIL